MDYFNKYSAAMRELMHSPSLSGILSRNAVGSLIVRIGASLLAFLINVLLARFLGVSEYGLFVYAASWLNILLIPASLGFDKLLVREIAIYQSRNELGKLKGIYQFALSRTLGMSIIIGSFLFGIAYFTLSSQSLATVLYWAALLIPIGAIIRLQQAALQGLHFVALGQLPEFIIQPTILLLLSLVVHFWAKQFLMASQVMTLNVFAGVIALLIGGHLLRRSLPLESLGTKIIFDRHNWVPSLVPLMLVGAVFILNSQLATVLLGFLSDTRQVAIFAAADKWTGFSIFMLVALNPALAPIFASLYAHQERERLQRIVTLSSQIIALFALIPLLAFMIVPQLFLSAFGNDFSAGRIPLIILAVGQFVNASTGSVGVLLSMTGYERFVVEGAGLGILINLFLGILLIPYLGAVGAAIAAATSVIISNVVLSIFVLQKLKIMPTAVGGLFVKRKVSLP